MFGCKLPHSLDILLSRAVSGAVLLSREAPGRRLCPPQIYAYGRSGLRVHTSDAIMQGGVTVASGERFAREFRHTCHLRPSWRVRLGRPTGRTLVPDAVAGLAA